MEEIYKDIEGYAGLYQVSNMGNVKSLNYNKTKRERILKAEKDVGGYLRVALRKQGTQKHYKIHRLVAEAFIPNPNNYKQVNHIDEDKTNNSVDNLEWCSAKYNSSYGTRTHRITKKNSKQVLFVEVNNIYQSAKQIEKEFGFPHQSISKVCTGKRKTYKGLHFKFV